jgi:hypothetical protein
VNDLYGLEVAQDAADYPSYVTDFQIPEATRTAIADAARVFAGLDTRSIGSIAEAFRGLDATRLGDMAAISQAAKAFEGFRPIVAPQVAEALKSVDMRIAPSFAEAMKAMGPQPFKFAKALEGVQLGPISPAFSESLRTLQLPRPISADFADAIRSLPKVTPTDFAPRVQVAAEEAFALAEVESVAVAVDESVGEIERMSPEKRRALAIDVAVLIAAFVTLAAWLSTGDLRDPKGAGFALAFAASLVRVYWRLTDKI